MQQATNINFNSRVSAMKTPAARTIKFIALLLGAFCALGMLPGSTPAAWAQQCTAEEARECTQDCGPIQDVGKQGFGACMASCRARCGKHNPATCKNGTGVILPKYYILGLVYAPPGCTNTSNTKCVGQSLVDYQASSTMGTKVSTDKSFATNLNLSVDANVGIPGVGKLDVGASGGFNNSHTDTNSQTISKGQTLDIKANGAGDGVDHNQDAFILLLNPAVAVSESQQALNGRCGTTQVKWYLGVSGSSPTQQRYTVYVQWLKNPATMPPNVAQQLQALGFTNQDYQTILAQDPFANGSITIDQNRFAPTTYSFPYEPPLQQSCIAMSDTIKNQLQTSVESKAQNQYSVGFSEKLSGIDIGIFSLGVNSDQKFTWTVSSTDSDTTDSSQSATATIACPSSGYQGPTIMTVYWDKLFGSFLFVPTAIPSVQALMLHTGTAIDALGKPVTHAPVTLSVANKTYHTWTNNRGGYFFFKPAGLPSVNGLTGQLSIKGITRTVPLGASQALQVRLP